MTQAEQFRLIAEVHVGSESRVYRAERWSDGACVIIKRLTAEYPSPSQIVRFEREFSLLRQLAGPGIPAALELQTCGHSRFIVFDDEGAESLARLPVPLPLETFFLLARELVTILGRVHAAHVLHKDVTPANVVLHPTHKLVRLIDFGLAAQLPREVHAANRPALLEGTLLYMSPEQTGRINRGVDYRADYYGLGATLYYALTGHPPFESDDPLELVHCHIARQPMLACKRRPGVPRGLSRVLHKLLAKTPEERYQSSVGLLADLARCQAAAERGVDEEFALGSADVTEQFIVSEALYGREEQVATLLSAVARATGGRVEVLLMPGAPGIGKSALVSEVQRPVVACRGLYAAGKFDQYSRGIPFAAVLQAFRGLLRQMLTEEEGQLNDYREAFDTALGINVSVIAELLPELTLITGRRPPPLELPPSESQSRFELTFQNFVGVLAQKEHPLVLVLDDLQWADLSSLNLLTQLCTTPGRGHFLVIGAYRDGEVGEQHPLHITLRELTARGVQMTTLAVGPLAELHVQALVSATLRAPVAEVTSFARVLFERTGGNPFFVTQILRKLHHDEVITFNRTARCFQVSAQALHLLPVADNVADLMSAAVAQLPPQTQRALRLAACIGNELDLATLAAVSGTARVATAEALWPALQAGLILPLSGAYRTVSDDDDTVVRYRFVHDRVQQAAYTTLGPAERAPTHHAIGERLLAQLPNEEREQRLFEIVSHLNKGAALRTQAADRDALADLNLLAARRAMAATAFASAWELLQTALELRGRDRFGRDYQASLELNTAAAEAAGSTGELAAMDALVDEVEREARTLMDKIHSREVRIQAYVARGRGHEALRVAQAHLADLGETISLNPTTTEVMLELARTRLALGWRTPEQLLLLEPIRDPIKHAAIRACGLIHSFAYNIDPLLTTVLGFRQLTLALRHGLAPATPLAIASYGVVVCGALGDIPLGVRFGRAALTLMQRSESARFRSHVCTMLAWFNEAWVRPFREVGELALKGWSLALDIGELQAAQQAAMLRILYNLWGNRPIEDSLREARGFRQFLESSGGPPWLGQCQVIEQTLAKLLDPGTDIAQLTGDFFNQALFFATAGKKDPQVLLLWGQLRSWLLYLEGRVDEALIQLDVSRPVLSSAPFNWLQPVWHAQHAMLDAARLGKLSILERGRAELRIARSLHTLRGLARHNPETFLHRIALIEAERAASLGHDNDAIAAFDRAIQLAHAARLPGDEAVAGERAASFYSSRERTTIARAYLRDACGAWTTWGARGRVQTLQARFPELAVAQSVGLSVKQSSQGVSGAMLAQAFDATAVIQAAQAIADETDIPKLLDRVMTRALEHAGARRGTLVLERAGMLRIKAVADVAAGGVLRMPDQPLGDASSADDPLAAAVARYALRTGEPVVLDDAQAVGGPFAQDVWVQAHGARSVLALPLSRQGRALGVLVLDNDLTTAAFTPERLAALRVLATQAAIALDNAVLQSDLQTALQEQVELVRANQRFVPAEFLTALDRPSITAVQLGDSVQKELTILFSDMRSFTSHVEGNTPEQNIHFINDYLATMEPAILSHGGFVDSYIGDAIMALFAVGADAALHASIDMLRSLHRYNGERRSRGAREVRIGIGLNTGIVTLGTIGGPQRIKCGVIGDAVNLGARVESLSKGYGVSLILSSHTVSRLQSPRSFLLRELDRVRVVGRQGVVTLYECFDADPPELRERKLAAADDWSAALRASDARDFAAALAHLDACRPLLGEDVTWFKRQARCKRYLAEPPPSTWDGVEEMTQK